MADILLIKTISGLKPSDENSEEALKRFKIGDIVKAKISKPRSNPFHNKYFAMIRCFISLQDTYKKEDIVLHDIKLKLQMYDIEYSFDGKIYPKFHSISFFNMDAIEFAEFYSKSIDVLLDAINKLAVNKNCKVSVSEFENRILDFL